MKRAFLTLAVLALGVSAVAAQDPIAARKDLMKAIGKETASGARMLKGEAPFNLDQAKAIFKAYEACLRAEATGRPRTGLCAPGDRPLAGGVVGRIRPRDRTRNRTCIDKRLSLP